MTHARAKKNTNRFMFLHNYNVLHYSAGKGTKKIASEQQKALFSCIFAKKAVPLSDFLYRA